MSIDRFHIVVGKLPIDSIVIDHPEEFAAQYGFTDVSVTLSYEKRDERRKAYISLLPNKALVIVAEENAGRWLARSVSGTAGAILYGHNGRVLAEDSLIAFLCRLRHLCEKVVLSNYHDQIIPGESPKSLSYWSRLEIFFQAWDVGGSLFMAMRNVRHPEIRTRALHYHEETVSLKGKKVKFIVYNKTGQMASTLEKYGELPPPPILRFELRLDSAALTKHFTHSRNFRKIEDHRRLVRFTADDLKEVFLNFVGNLQGVYVDKSAKKVPAVARFLGQISRRTGLPTLELAELYAAEKQLSAKSLSQLRSDSAKHYAALGNTTAADLFSEEAFRNQPSIEVPKLEKAIGDMVTRFARGNLEIARAYTNWGDQADGRFIPMPAA